MATGTLKMWNAERGFGFIADDASGPDMFLHITALQAAGIDPERLATPHAQPVVEKAMERVQLISEGKYSVWFRTPVGEGAGVVEFGSNGTLSGGDTTFSYIGNWTQDGERFKAAIAAKRTAPGPPGVFGIDEIDIIVAGHSDGDASASCTGFAKQAPGLKLEVTLIRMRDEEGPIEFREHRVDLPKAKK